MQLKQQEYTKGFDSLRAVAVFLVVLWHYIPRNESSSIIHRVVVSILLPTGDFGVHLFFVMSGFLISSILIRQKLNLFSPQKIIGTFYIRRTLRIFPIYYCTLFLLVLTKYPTFPSNFWWYASYCSNILIMKNGDWGPFAHSWSLAVEEQFYLLWPLFIVYIPAKHLHNSLLVTIVIGILSLVVTYKSFWPFQLFVTDCICSFAIGGLYAFYHLTQPENNPFNKYFHFIFGFSLLAYLYWKIAPFTPIPSRLIFMGRFVDSLLSICLLHLALFQKSQWARKIFWENPILNYLGKVSYGIYLYHFPLPTFFYFLLSKMNADSSLYAFCKSNSLLIKISMVLGLAALSFTFIEKPILRLKNRYTLRTV